MRRIHIVKLAILPKEIYIFNAFLTQVPDSELQTRVIKWMPFPVRIQVLPCPFSLPFWSRIHESHLHGILSTINSHQKAFYFSWLSKFCCSITIFFLTWTGADADVFIHVMIVRLFIGKYLCKLFALSIFFAIVAMTNLLEFNFISAFQLPCCTPCCFHRVTVVPGAPQRACRAPSHHSLFHLSLSTFSSQWSLLYFMYALIHGLEGSQTLWVIFSIVCWGAT